LSHSRTLVHIKNHINSYRAKQYFKENLRGKYHNSNFEVLVPIPRTLPVNNGILKSNLDPDRSAPPAHIQARECRSEKPAGVRILHHHQLLYRKERKTGSPNGNHNKAGWISTTRVAGTTVMNAEIGVPKGKLVAIVISTTHIRKKPTEICSPPVKYVVEHTLCSDPS
jgi:hypothetical protein